MTSDHPQPTTVDPTTATWWGPEAFEIGETVLWRIASLRLWAQRAQREWKIAHEWEGDSDEQEALCERQRGVDFPEEGRSIERHVVLTLKNEIFQDVKAALDAAGIEIPFPHRSLYTGAATAPLPIRLVETAARESPPEA